MINQLLSRVFNKTTHNKQLGDKSRSGSGLVLPGGWELALGLVVTSQSVDTGLDKNETVLGVDVLAVAFQVLADADGLLDKMVEILRDFRGHSLKTCCQNC